MEKERRLERTFMKMTDSQKKELRKNSATVYATLGVLTGEFILSANTPVKVTTFLVLAGLGISRILKEGGIKTENLERYQRGLMLNNN